MNKKKIISEIRKDLYAKRDLGYRDGAKRFFKEPIDPIGVRAKDTRKIAAVYFKEVGNASKKDFLELCEQMLENGVF